MVTIPDSYDYSNSGRTSALYKKAISCLSRYVYDHLNIAYVEFALFTTLFMFFKTHFIVHTYCDGKGFITVPVFVQ